MPTAVPTRRAVLRGFGAAVASLWTLPGCTSAPDEDDPPSSPRTPDPDLAVVARALAAGAQLAQRYAATVAAHPGLAGLLEPLAAEHAAHGDALDVSEPGTPPASPLAESPAPSPLVPTVAAEALAALAAAERASATARVADLLQSAPTVARLLASIAASQAAHAALLEVAR